MKPTELRIGNLILGEYYNHNDEEREDNKYELCKVVGIDAVGFSEHNIRVEGLDETGIEEYERFEGVRITEEWLLRLGFKRYPWGLVVDNLLFKNPDLKCKALTLEIGNGNRTEIKYIHQLQNLYFALTGKELELK